MLKNYFLKPLFIGSFLLTAFISEAQHDPYFTHFAFIQQAYNPAAAGVKANYICITGLAHYQYRGYTDYTETTGSDVLPAAKNQSNVAPETYNFNANTLLDIGGKGRNLVGVGVTFLDDKIGYMKTTSYKAAINYRLPIQGNFAFLSIGIEAGGTAFGYDNPRFTALDPNDKHIPNGGGSESNPNFGAGLLYQQKTLFNKLENFYVGASYNNLNAANYNFSVTMQDGGTRAVDMTFQRYLHLNTGADWQLANPNWKLEPAILVKYNPQFQMDLSMTALFSKMLRGGLAYRTKSDAISILLGYERGPLQVGYAYDVTLSKIRTVSDGTHEVFVKYCIPIVFPPTPGKTPKLTPRFMGRGAY